MVTQESPPTDLILVRHGQSLAHRDNSSSGQDAGLTSLGWQQAHLIAEWVATHYQPDLIVASKMMRTQQTGRVIAQRLQLPLVLEPGLDDADRPYWEELDGASAGPLDAWDRFWQPTPENAPDYSQFRARIRTSLAGILGNCHGKTAIIVTHGGVIGTILRSLFGGHQIFLSSDNGCLTHLSWHEGHWRLVYHNTTAHLAPLIARTAVAGRPSGQSPANGERPLAAPAAGTSSRSGASPPDIVPTSEELEALTAFGAPRPESSVLDVGTGSGSIALAFAPLAAHVTGIDTAPDLLESAERARVERAISNVDFQWSEPAALVTARRQFDLAVARDLLNAPGDPVSTIRSLTRLLLPGGKLLLDQLIGSADPVRRATQDAIESRRDPSFAGTRPAAELERVLDEAGFCLERSEHYAVTREASTWLQDVSDSAQRSDVEAMLEAAIEADAAGLNVRRGRDGNLLFTHHRVRLLARHCDTPEDG